MPSLIIRDRVFPPIVRLLGSRQLFPVGSAVRKANHVRQVCHADPWNSILFPEFRGKGIALAKRTPESGIYVARLGTHSKNEIRLHDFVEIQSSIDLISLKKSRIFNGIEATNILNLLS